METNLRLLGRKYNGDNFDGEGGNFVIFGWLIPDILDRLFQVCTLLLSLMLPSF